MKNTKLTKMEIITLVDSLTDYSGNDDEGMKERIINPLLEKLVVMMEETN